jgi:hypothetical protein
MNAARMRKGSSSGSCSDVARRSHRSQYERLRLDHARRFGVHFVEESDFRRDLLRILEIPAGKDCLSQTKDGLRRLFSAMPGQRKGRNRLRFVLFLVDDTIFVRPFKIQNVADSCDRHPGALGSSLRLGANITRSYSDRRELKRPTLTPAGDHVCRFVWSTSDSDFGYPLELSSSAYRRADLLRLFRLANFENPNTLESMLARNSSLFASKMSELLCFDQSVAFCTPLNRVQNVFPNRVGEDSRYSVGRLARLFDDGWRIETAGLRGFEPDACHVEKELRLVRNGGR